ncbi:glycosyltransferase family 1 protein [Haloterrigena sp. H1]|uniref:glycosyltransferase family 4 protein n=1 Tax=Haloterrigena sp. H1 TaxID=2552943 RepID=UPI00110EE1CE|nr:glycosyltransferase family 4 protein [Haloterrigena sp. H1]TMT87286.1 glycosyltransferase family 1 protein [Haloterrigena sp. H1]
MKILLVTHRYPPHTGGVETHVREIAVRLDAKGHDVTVFSADATDNINRQNVDDGVLVRRYRSARPGNAFYIAPQLVKAVRQSDADVVHAHNYHAFPLLFAALGVTGQQFVVTTHYHGESNSDIRNALLELYRPLGRWAIRRADDVIAVSDWERKQLQADFGVDATVIPNGLNKDRFANAAPEPNAEPYLLCVGRLEEYKGIQYAIRALSELPGYKLLIAGRGPYMKALKQIVSEEGVADRVTFLGYVADDRLPGLYAGATAYVTLSAVESYGMTVAEALTAGTPCVVRESGALAGWADRDGCVGVDSMTPAAIATAVREAINCDVDAATVPDWDDIVERIVDQYD